MKDKKQIRDGKMLDALKFLHNNKTVWNENLPKKTVRPFIRDLALMGAIEYIDGRWKCVCSGCKTYKIERMEEIGGKNVTTSVTTRAD